MRGGISMKKQPQITDQTKTNLRTAFMTLYVQKSMDKISVREVTDLAGYNRGTFYAYYNDVYDILNQVEDELIEKINEVLQEAITQSDTFDLTRQMGVIVELMRTHSPYASALLGDHGDPRFINRLKEVIWPLLNRYFVPSEGHSAYQMTLLSEFYLTGLLAAVNAWITDPRIPIDQFISFMIASVFPMQAGRA